MSSCKAAGTMWVVMLTAIARSGNRYLLFCCCCHCCCCVACMHDGKMRLLRILGSGISTAAFCSCMGLSVSRSSERHCQHLCFLFVSYICSQLFELTSHDVCPPTTNLVLAGSGSSSPSPSSPWRRCPGAFPSSFPPAYCSPWRSSKTSTSNLQPSLSPTTNRL